VVVNGRIRWVLDLYTTTTFYPYSERINAAANRRLALNSGLDGEINYLRNSVKAVVDANDGDLVFYMVDPDDPIVRSWAETHPGLFRDRSEMPSELEDHLRYPQDLFRVQSQLYLEYHVTQEAQLFSGTDAWSFPGDPSDITREGTDQLRGEFFTGVTPYVPEILPYYLLTELPGEDELSYLLLQPFNPLTKRNMVAFLVADSTPGKYGRLIDFRMPQGKLVDGAEQAGQRIEQDADIAEQLSLWRGGGSDVTKGDMLVVPIENALVYFQPIFLEEEGGAFPEFRRVAVVYSDKVEWADTLDGALEKVFGIGDGEEEPEEPSGGLATVEELIAEAEAAFANADTALRAGDLAGYQRWVEEAQRILGEIADLLEAEPNASKLVPAWS
jgi:hypothetical protein